VKLSGAPPMPWEAERRTSMLAGRAKARPRRAVVRGGAPAAKGGVPWLEPVAPDTKGGEGADTKGGGAAATPGGA